MAKRHDQGASLRGADDTLIAVLLCRCGSFHLRGLLDGMATEIPEREELASVVVAGRTETSASQPWYVTLRPWLFCLIFLAVAEIGVRVYFDWTLSLRHQRFDNFANAAAEDV